MKRENRQFIILSHNSLFRVKETYILTAYDSNARYKLGQSVVHVVTL